MAAPSQSSGPAGPGIGLVAVTAIVMGNMIGAGIFTIPDQLGRYGVWGILAFCLTAAGAVVLGLTFADLARQIPKTGGPYAYTRAAFGDFAGFWLAWGYWIGLWSGQVAIACVFANYVGVFIPVFRENMLWNGLLALAVLWLVTGLNLRGVKTAGAVAVITTIIRALPLVAIGTAGWFWVHPGNYTTTLPQGESPWSAVAAAATVTMYAFLGLESGTVPAGSVRNPGKTIPRATVIGILLVALLYIASTAVVMGVIPTRGLEEGTTAFASAGSVMWGGVGHYAVAFAGVVSTLGALSGFTLLNGQVPMAAALDSLFPAPFRKMNRRAAPWFGIVASSVLISLFLTAGYAVILASGSQTNNGLQRASIIIATVTIVLPYAFCGVAEMVLVTVKRERAGLPLRPRHLALPALSFLYSLLIIAGAGWIQIGAGLLLGLVGLPVYVVVRSESLKAQLAEHATARPER